VGSKVMTFDFKIIQMKQKFSLVSDDVLDEIKNNQLKILAFFEQSHKDQLTDYITESQAKELLKKKATWFWQMRKSGQLHYSKIGKAIYYAKSDIIKLFEKN
jgi:hypothetical protein